MKTPNRTWLKATAAVALFLIALTSCGSSQQTTKKYSREDELNEKITQLTQTGWQIHGSSRTLKGKLIEHYDKLEANPDIYEVSGSSTGCRSITVCRTAALNAAAIDFATKMGQDLKGKTMRDMGIDEGAETPTEYNKFQEACVSKFEASIKGELVESFAIIRSNESGLNNYTIYYLVDRASVRKQRTQAIKDAMEESKLRNDYANSVEKFIDGDIEK